MKKIVENIAAITTIAIGLLLGSLYSINHGGESIHVPGGALQLYAKDGFLDVPLINRTTISPDTYIFEFSLPDTKTALGLQVGDHILIHANISTKTHPEGQEIFRKYTPVSRTNQTGTFELVIKIYRPNVHPLFPDGGIMTPYLERLQIGDKIRISGPRGKLVYSGDGDIRIDMPERKQKMNAKKIGLIAGGTGIAPMYQVIQAILENPSDETRVALLFGNRSEKDILLRDKLEKAAEDPRISVHFAVNQGDDGWKGFEGHVTKEMLVKTMPGMGEDVLICTCGPAGFNKMLADYLEELGYPADHVFKF